MRITIHLSDENSITYNDVKNAYPKGDTYYIITQDLSTFKYLLADIKNIDYV